MGTSKVVCLRNGRPLEKCHEPCHWCDMSDLPATQCALPCHRNARLSSGLRPAEEPVRGVVPKGVRVWPLSIDAARLEQVASVVQVDPLGRRAPTLIRVPSRKRPKSTSRCRYDADLEDWCTPEHTRDCRSNLCQGCEPCQKAHCGFRWSCPNHVDAKVDERTCPQCIGTTRANIADIVELTVLVSAELEHAGVDGEAANLAADATRDDDYHRRVSHALAVDQDRGLCDYPPRPEVYGVLDAHGQRSVHLDEQHPYVVLARWLLFFHARGGRPAPQFITVTGAAAYLTGLLATTVPHDVDVFDPFAREIARCLTHLQEVLSDSRRPETGAPCPKCTDAIRAAGTAGHAARLIKRRDNADRTGSNDAWVCTDVPAHRWLEADYRLRVAGDYLAYADALTGDQMRRQYGITPGNLRRWANGWVTESGASVPPCVRKRGRDSNGRMLYDVRDARLREDERRGWCDYPRIRDVYPEREQVSA